MALRDLVLECVARVSGCELDRMTVDSPLPQDDGGISEELSNEIIRRLDLDRFAVWNLADVQTIRELIGEVRRLVGLDYDDGDLPNSINLRVQSFRWHDSNYWIDGPEDFWRPFEDGHWKWDTRYRYAGPGLNCGHYLAITEQGATAEAVYYAGGEVPRGHVLVSLDVDLRNILNLTRQDVFMRVLQDSVADVNRIKFISPIDALRILVEKEDYARNEVKGGNPITDYIGHWASRAGYDGILFYNVRAISDHDHASMQTADRDLDAAFGNGVVNQLQTNCDNYNLVVFSGASLVSSTVRYCARGKQRRFGARKQGAWRDNPYYQQERQSILARSSEYGPEYQEQRYRTFCVQKPTLEWLDD